MLLRLIVALAALVMQLGACTDTQSKKAAIDELDRRHTEDMQRMGGGGSGGGSM
jgi:hypothetical protein